MSGSCSSSSTAPTNSVQAKEWAWLDRLSAIACRAAERATRLRVRHMEKPTPRLAVCLYAAFELWPLVIETKASDFDDERKLQALVDKARPTNRVTANLIRFRVDGSSVVNVFIDVDQQRAFSTGDFFREISPTAHEQARMICGCAYREAFASRKAAVWYPLKGSSMRDIMRAVIVIFIAAYPEDSVLFHGGQPELVESFVTAVFAAINSGWAKGVAACSASSDEKKASVQ